MKNYHSKILTEINYLYSFFKGDKDIILDKFCNELLKKGWNVSNAIKEFDVSPHIMNEKMINLYSHSEAFIYECIVSSLDPEKRKKDRFISSFLKNNISKKTLSILCYGDGIGIDSQINAQNGHNVTYFDFEGPSYHFAQHRLHKMGIIDKVLFKSNKLDLKNNYYDVIICREVLEHTEDPIKIMKDLRKYLNDDGICFLSESFKRVDDNFPTHLTCNLKYVGKSIKLMVNIGFRLLDRFDNTNLLVFKKTDLNDNLRFDTIPFIPLKRQVKKKLREKLIYYLS